MMSTPCGRWDAAAGRHCGSTQNVRLYIQGYRCNACTPSAQAGRPEPSGGSCAPLRHGCLPAARCTTWEWQQQPWRLLATGGRDRADWRNIWAELDYIHAIHPNLTVVHGACYPKPVKGKRPDKSADWLVHLWCQANGVKEEEHPANWTRYGRGAGPRRNAEMVALGADEAIAFPGEGPGTYDCMRRASAAGIPVKRVLPPITNQDHLFQREAAS
jgi:hypothetical protein